ncbi:emp24/gp25L/p24 family/GOLD-domain-containing protein [Phlyctochytrium arcticum]|nr:emp24/gp25L/p24 family/GOLD-domain-containing protein [Phlyctochytrium arcticum]
MKPFWEVSHFRSPAKQQSSVSARSRLTVMARPASGALRWQVPSKSFAPLLALAVILATRLQTATAHNTFTIHVAPRTEQCFNERLFAQDRLDISYEVQDGGSLDIDFVIFNPNDSPIFTNHAESFATAGFNAESEGVYAYCFGNKMSSIAEKRVSFTVHGPDEKWKIEEKELQLSIDDPTENLQTEIRVLDVGIRAIRDEHAFLKSREARHRETAESTKSRVFYWSLLQTSALIAVCYFQVTYLKRFFEMRGGRIV